MIQQRLATPRVKYSRGYYNKVKGDSQAIRITEGCPHNCDWCYEPIEFKIFGVPKIERNKVLIYDMNILCKKEAFEIISSLPNKLNGKHIFYEFVCGLDFRFMTKEMAELLYSGHFGRFNKKNWYKGIRLAWDRGLEYQYKMKDCIEMLVKVGFKRSLITLFILNNHKITTLEDNMRKLDLCKVWNVQVADCRYDNQIKTFNPIAWTTTEMKTFRKKVRNHNQLVNFGIDPELNQNKNTTRKQKETKG